MSYGFEPHDLFLSDLQLLSAAVLTTGMVRVGEGCTRGSAGLGGLEGCYTGTQTQPSQGPNINIFLRLSPTHGRMNQS